MTPEIKNRIEQIQRGEVPGGYKKTKAGIMPLDWCENKEYQARDVFKSVTNKKHHGEFEVLSATQDRGVIPRNQVDIDIKYNEDNIAGYKKVDKCDFVISLRSFQGGIEYSEYEGLVSPAYTVLKPILPISDGYYKAYFKTGDYIERLNIGTYGIRDGKQIGYEDFGDMVIHYPPLAEQEKIADILAAQDKVITLKEKLLEEKKKQKKYMMQQLLTGKKRLPGFSGEWEQRKLSEITFAAGRRNKGNLPLEPFAVTNDKGFIAQRSAHDDFGYMNNVDRSVYMVVKPNSFAYNPARINVGSIGYYDGKEDVIVSSLYEIFQTVDEVDDRFLWHWFKSSELMKWIKRLQEGSVRFYFYYDKLEECNLMMPSLAEQRKISECLDAMDLSIEIRERELNEEKQKKKALMQLLLTGIVRVNV